MTPADTLPGGGSIALPTTSPGPICDLEDYPGLVYLGHLAAESEIALPDAGRPAQIAAAWLGAHVARDGARLWRARIEDVAVADSALGTWTLCVRTRETASLRPTLERRAALVRDGREISALAAPFLGKHVPPARDNPPPDLLDFCLLALVDATAPESRKRFAVTDITGRHMDITVRAEPRFKTAMEKLFRSKSGS